MPSHQWGDEDFDWDSLYNAETEIVNILKYGRIGVHSKEKYGTLRWSLFLCDGTLHSITHPGHMYSRYPNWLRSFDVKYEPLKLIAPFIRFFQVKIIGYAFTKICHKYPHIRDEIIMDAPRELLPPDLCLASAKLWSSTCVKCEEWSTTDNYKCPHCGEIKK